MIAIRRLCVFCGSNPGKSPEYTTLARGCGRKLAELGVGIVYGGGKIGLMGHLAEAAIEARGEVIGVIPKKLMDLELAHLGLTRLLVVESMHERKAAMADMSDGFIAMPGGIGTLDEFFEMFTWLQLGFQAKPVAILNCAGFFDPLVRFLDHVRNEGFLRQEHFESVLVDDDPGRLVSRMREFTPGNASKWLDR
jgi:uncharacterized protein (TIGR00730 family)